jgi:hypothetical protein
VTEAVLPVAAIDAAWLTEILRAGGTIPGTAVVAAVEREVCGTGQLADSYRFTLTYDRPQAGPATVVGKFASEDPTSRAFGQQSGYYRNEIRFYQEIAPDISVAIPTPLHAALADNDTDFVLLMQDMSPARVVDQLEGCSADEAAAVVEQIAAFHAASWKRATLADTAWLQGTVLSFSAVTDGFPATVTGFRESIGDLVPDDQLALAGRLNDHLDAWKQVFSEPQCLWHSDLRADNLLFDAKGGTVPVALLDWQGVGYGRGTIDVGYFLGTSLAPDVREKHERELVSLYHQGLVARGVPGYREEDCWDDYRLGALHTLQVGVFGFGAVKRSERGDRMWCNWIERGAAQVEHLDSYEVLGRR